MAKEGNLVTMGAKCKTFAKVRKEKEQQVAMQPPVEELTTEQRVDNIAQNVSNALNDHGNVLNAVAYYIENTDTKVAKAGGLMQWVQKDIAKKQRIEEKKREYAARKDSA